MAAAVQTLAAGSAESWDDDFDFHRSNSRVSSPKRVLKPNNMAENWDDDFVDQTRSSPRSIKKQQPTRHTGSSRGPTENWDDDFEDNDQPASRPSRLSTAPSQAENWDEEFAANEPPVENWDDEFGHSSDEDQADKEDRTVTANMRHFQPMHATPPPPVPPLPADLRMHDPHLSPTDSIFSLPTTIGRPESSAGYSITSVAALRPTAASTSARRFANLPPNTPTRERRRLRKKSRPPPMDGAVMELEDRSSPTPPEAYERTSTPEPSDAYPPDFNPQTPQHANPPVAAANKTPLLSRIGSVKKWRPGRKRLSTDPKDVVDTRREHDTEVTPRPPSVLAKVQQTPSDGILGVPGSVGRDELKNGKSMEKLGLGPSPRHIRKKRPNREPSPSPFSTRPNSMMVSSSSGSGAKPRHASSTAIFNSGNRSASASRTSFSASMEDLTYRIVRSVSRDKYKGKERERGGETEDKRVFMGGVRRISFGNKSTEHPKPDRDQLTSTPTPKDKGKGSRHGRSNTMSSMDTSRPPWVMESLALGGPPQLPAIPVLPLPLQLIPSSSTEPPPLPPLPPSESISKPVILLPAAELQPARSLPRPSLDVRPSTSDTVPRLPHSRKPSEAMNLLIAKHSASPQQAASLGRSSQPPKRPETSPTDGKVPRRNSLNDLRIPARITQAQTGLRRDLTLVKEFAKNVEQLKELQETYSSIITEIHTILHAESRPITPALPSLPTSPTNFFTPRRRSRSSATTMPPSAQIRTITISMTELQSKFAITWECAELLVEIGGGSTAPSRISKVQSKSSLASKVFPTSNSAPPEMMNSIGRRGRERAITLGGDEQKPALPEDEQKPNTMPATPRHSGDWNNTSGKNDLNSRQLLLLREMLSHPDADDSPQSVLERLRALDSQVNREWSWGGAMGSTITLPPSDGSSYNQRAATPSDRSLTKKRRPNRLGMSAVRDMLRNLKRSVTEANQNQHHQSPHPPSSESSVGLTNRPTPRRRAKTSTEPPGSGLGRESPAPHSRRDPRSPYNTVSSTLHKSPRRPSLASIFRFGHKNKSNANSGNSTDRSSVRNRPNAPSSSGTGSQAAMEDEDWDRVDDSVSDLDFYSPRTQRSASGGTDNSSTLRAKRANQGQPEKSPYLTFQDNLPPEPFTPRRGGPPGPEASRSSIWEGTWARGTKLSNVEEIVEGSTPVRRGPMKRSSRVFGVSPNPSLERQLLNAKQPQKQQQPPVRMNGKRLSGVPPVQHGGKTGSVRSTPPQWIEHAEGLPDLKLAMTPENIKPLLDSAREVLLRCTECMTEARTLLGVLENVRN